MSSILENICADKRAQVKAAKRLKSFDSLHKEALAMPPTRGFLRMLRSATEQNGAAFIAEIKKASPSAGVIRKNFSPASLANDYFKAGATCLSVLTDAPYFKGRNEDLIEASQVCSLPVLRKDFMLDVWQIAESRIIGADCVLLIMAALSDTKASELCRAAMDYSMDVLIEVHDSKELARALALPSPLIGVNSRDLKTMTTDLKKAAELVRTIPPDRFIVSESGIRTKDDVAKMKSAGARGFLIGESLLEQHDVGEALQKLKG
ncbi:MAG: indole-3-glycerol phosphate synthase TrpC [Bdellovibrionales bacterium]